MTVFLNDPDVRLYHGDALEVLRSLPDGSVDCCVTSPPYWGLRDYGTGEWDGGDPDCDHMRSNRYSASTTLNAKVTDGASEAKRTPYGDLCGKCGATRVDQQLGLEATPDLFVQNMVNVFREVRRVLAGHGTCWVNLGDSYAADRTYQVTDNKHTDVGNTKGSKVPAGLKQKDLVGIPWRVAFALQADGWYLRSDIIWAKPNPMPESVTDRPTKAHEYVFLLTKRPRYWFDAEAVREPHSPDGRKQTLIAANGAGVTTHENYANRAQAERWPGAGRNVRSVWQIATQPYPEAHFATFPEELARRCIVAGCPTRVCRVCGKPSERIVERETNWQERREAGAWAGNVGVADNYQNNVHGKGMSHDLGGGKVETVGWSDCGHNNWRPGVVLDPFIGSGTVAKVARDHQRHAIGIDLNQTYLELAARRLQQLSLLAEA